MKYYELALMGIYNAFMNRLIQELTNNRNEPLSYQEVFSIIKRENIYLKALAAEYIYQYTLHFSTIEVRVNWTFIKNMCYVDQNDKINFIFENIFYSHHIFPIGNILSFEEMVEIVYNMMYDKLLLDLTIDFSINMSCNRRNSDQLTQILEKYSAEIRKTAEYFVSNELLFNVIEDICRIGKGILYLNGKKYKILINPPSLKETYFKCIEKNNFNYSDTLPRSLTKELNDRKINTFQDEVRTMNQIRNVR